MSLRPNAASRPLRGSGKLATVRRARRGARPARREGNAADRAANGAGRGANRARHAGKRSRRAARRAPRLPLALGVAVAAWAALIAARASPLAPLLDHAVLADRRVPLALAVPGLAIGWTLMVAAMMLPGAAWTAKPTRKSTGPSTTGRAAGSAAWILGYLAVWSCAGFAFAGFDLAVHGVLEPRVPRSAGLLPPATVILCCAWLAAAVVLPPSRRSSAHRSTSHHRRHTRAVATGWTHGLACLALCWPVMLALEALAPGNLTAMALAGAVSTGARLARNHLTSRVAPIAHS